MLRLSRIRSFRKFASNRASVSTHVNKERHFHSGDVCKTNRATALIDWRELRTE